MRTFTLTLIMLLTAALGAFAGDDARHEAWHREMTQAKHEFLTAELKLTPAQQTRFFALYDAMDSEIRAHYRSLRRQAEAVEAKGDRATDAERLAMAQALFEGKAREGEIEMKYFPKFKEVLTPVQLLKLKKAEQTFKRRMAREHRQRRRNQNRR